LLEKSDGLIGTADVIVSVKKGSLFSKVRKDLVFVSENALLNASDVIGFGR
jgi:hypothetical protein